jgi:AhpD family alkylhydroperoxidase
MKKFFKPILGMILAIAFSVLVARTLAKAETQKSDAPRTEALADIEKTLGFVPHFFTEFPAEILPGTWEEMKTLQMNPKTSIPPKVKELIGLGVAAQIPCVYCINAHTEFARANGATEAEIGEAVAEAALTRHWSTFMNGVQLDEGAFRAEIAKVTANMRAAKQSGTAMPKPMNVMDGKSALQDATQMYGFAPEFLKRFPDVARAGAWKAMRDVEINPGALSGKYKDLVGLAVASQIPCRYCIIADNEFAKLDGATDAEITEAVAMASLTRQMSTLLNGMKVDMGQFNSDITRMVKGAQASRTAAPAEAPVRLR